MHKHLSRVEVKDAARGEVTAIFSTFDVVDSDGDVTLAGAFDEGTVVPISAYGHTSWQGAPPVGKATIHTTAKEAILEGQFFMDTQGGKDTFTAVKELGALGQWSYGYDPVEFHFGDHDGKDVRFLSKLKVHEVSPVLLGAGVGTRTLSAKSLRDEKVYEGEISYRSAIRPHKADVTTQAWDAVKATAQIGSLAPVQDLRSVYAWVNPLTDPEAKSSYLFPHHHGVAGPANVRACLVGIAMLNGAGKGNQIPEADRAGVYEHLAAHLRDHDQEPPELRSDSSRITFSDELASALVEVGAVIDSATRVVALRAEKGKSMSRVNVELLEWLDDDLRRLKSIVNNPAEEVVQELLRFESIRFALGEHQ